MYRKLKKNCIIVYQQQNHIEQMKSNITALLVHGELLLLVSGELVLLAHGEGVLLVHGDLVLLVNGELVLLTC